MLLNYFCRIYIIYIYVQKLISLKYYSHTSIKRVITYEPRELNNQIVVGKKEENEYL